MSEIILVEAKKFEKDKVFDLHLDYFQRFFYSFSCLSADCSSLTHLFTSFATGALFSRRIVELRNFVKNFIM